MKIAIVAPNDLTVFLFCKGIIKALQNCVSNEIYIISDTLGESSGGYYTNILRSWDTIHVPIRCYRFIDPLKDLKYMLSLYKILRREKIEAVVNVTTKPNTYGSIVAKIANVKKNVCCVWGMGAAFLESNSLKKRLIRFSVLNLYMTAFKVCSNAWFTNEADYDYFISRGMLSTEKAILTKNYVNTEEYSPSSISTRTLVRLQRELGLKEKDKVVIMVARMSWSKGVREFVESSIILKDKLPQVKFILVGPKDEGSPDSVPESYIRANEKNGNFKWLGFRNDVKALYSISDLAVFPSYYREGGFPRGLTEPMSMGKPIITTNSIHCKGTVEDSKNGLLVPIKDSQGLADAIEQLMNDDIRREKFGRYSRQKALNEFSEEVIVSKVIKEVFCCSKDFAVI